MSVYTISLNEQGHNLFNYQDKFIVVVNIADQCGLNTQLMALRELHQSGVAHVVAFPSASFKQLSLGNDQIKEWCEIDQRLPFPVMDIVDVNGQHTHPLFKYLKRQAINGLSRQYLFWNFTKFLILPYEAEIIRFSPLTSVEKIENYIKKVGVP